jgi:hypothetical protein
VPRLTYSRRCRPTTFAEEVSWRSARISCCRWKTRRVKSSAMRGALCCARRRKRWGKHKTPQFRANRRFESADLSVDNLIGHLPAMEDVDLPPKLLL